MAMTNVWMQVEFLTFPAATFKGGRLIYEIPRTGRGENCHILEDFLQQEGHIFTEIPNCL